MSSQKLKNIRPVGAVCLLAIMLCACSEQAPNADRPWFVLLDLAPNATTAENLAEDLEERFEEKLAGCSALRVRDQGVVLHWVVSRGLSSEQAGKDLVAQLSGATPTRLPVLNVNSIERLAEEEGQEVSVPEEASALEELAALLPTPGQEQLGSFLLVPASKRPAAATISFGRVGPASWTKAFGALGLSATAEAVYRDTVGPLGNEVWVYVGLMPEGSGGQDWLPRIHQFLLDHQVPSAEEFEKAHLEEQEKKKKKRRRRRKSKKRSRRKKARPRKIEAPTPVVAKVELPIALKRWMPWGESQVYQMDRIGWVQRSKATTKTTTRSALFGLGPEGRAVVLVLAQDPDLAARLLTPFGLGECHGINLTSAMLGSFMVVPEVGVEGEVLDFLGAQSFRRWLPRSLRRQGWAKAHLGRMVTKAAYRSPKGGWRVSWVDFDSTSAAEQVLNEAYIEPRKSVLQSVLKSKRSVHYDVGLRIVEVGDVQGWFLKGARGGRLQELYFQAGTRVVLMQTAQRKKDGFEVDDLLARAELLQIWAEDPQ